MSVAYVDSSCIVALAFREAGSTALRKRLRRFDRLVSSSLLEAEVSSALRREHQALTSEYWSAVELICPDRTLAAEIARTLDAGYLRGADCWHVATALYLAPDPAELAFLTLDSAQSAVALRLGFRTA